MYVTADDGAQPEADDCAARLIRCLRKEDQGFGADYCGGASQMELLKAVCFEFCFTTLSTSLNAFAESDRQDAS